MQDYQAAIYTFTYRLRWLNEHLRTAPALMFMADYLVVLLLQTTNVLEFVSLEFGGMHADTLCMLAVLAVVGHSFRVMISTEKGRVLDEYIIPWSVGVLSLITYVLRGFLVLPLMIIFLSKAYHHCNLASANSTLLSSSAFVCGVSVTGATAYTLLNGICTLFAFASLPQPANLGSRVHNRYDFLNLVAKVAMSLIYALLDRGTAFEAVGLTTTMTLFVLHLLYLPYYYRRANELKCGSLAASTAVFAVCLVNRLPGVTPLSYNVVAAVSLVAFTVGYLAVTLLWARRTYAGIAMAQMDDANIFDTFDIMSPGSVERATRFVHVNPTSENIEKGKALYSLATSRWPTSALLRTVFSAYMLAYRQPNSVIAQLKAAYTFYPAPDIASQIFCLNLQRVIVSGEVHGEHSMTFRRRFREAEKYHKRALTRMVHFWKYVESKAKMHLLFRTSSGIHEAAMRAERAYKLLLTMFPSHPKVCRAYAAFLQDVRFDAAAATIYRRKADGPDEAPSAESEETSGPAASRSPVESLLFSAPGENPISEENDGTQVYTKRQTATLNNSRAVMRLFSFIIILLTVTTTFVGAICLWIKAAGEQSLFDFERISVAGGCAHSAQSVVMATLNLEKSALDGNCTDCIFHNRALNGSLHSLFSNHKWLLKESVNYAPIHSLLYKPSLKATHFIPGENATVERVVNLATLGMELVRSGFDYVASVYCPMDVASVPLVVQQLYQYVVTNGPATAWQGYSKATSLFFELGTERISSLRIYFFVATVVSAILISSFIWFIILPAVSNIALERAQVGQLFLALPKDKILNLLRMARETKTRSSGWELRGETSDSMEGAMLSGTQRLSATAMSTEERKEKEKDKDDGDKNVDADEETYQLTEEFDYNMSTLRWRIFIVTLMVAAKFIVTLVLALLLSYPWQSLDSDMTAVANCSANVRRARMVVDEMLLDQHGIDFEVHRDVLLATMADLQNIRHTLVFRHKQWWSAYLLLNTVVEQLAATVGSGFPLQHNETLQRDLDFQLSRFIEALRLLAYETPEHISPYRSSKMIAAVVGLDAALDPALAGLRRELESRAEMQYTWVVVCFTRVMVVSFFFTIIKYFFILRPMMTRFSAEAEGNTALLLMIPPNVVQEVPLIRKYLEDGTLLKEEELAAVLREHKVHSESLMQSVPDGIVVTNQAGIITQINKSAASMFGYDTVELLGQNVKVMSPPEIAREHDQYLRDYFSSGRTRRNVIGKDREMRGRRKDGTQFPILLTVSEHVMEDQTMTFIGIIKDITKLKEMENKWQQAIEASSDGLWNWDVTTDDTWYAPRYKEMVGYKDEEFPNVFASFRNAIHPDDLDATMRAMSACMENSTDLDITCRLKHKDGNYLWIHARGKVVVEDWVDGVRRPRKFAGSIADVTAKKASEDALLAKKEAETSNESKRRFLANMSHEIRTPLNGVVGMSRILANDRTLNPRQSHFATIIHNCSTQLMSIVNDILDFSKLEAGMMEFEHVPVRVHETIPEIIDFISLQCYEKGVECAVLVSPQIPEVLVGDAKSLRQVLLNLSNNAIKFTDQGCVLITVAIHAPRNEKNQIVLMCRVRDTGPGIDHAGRKALFERFSQVDTSSSRRHGGTGLGLAICKQMVEGKGGHINVESVVGEGSTFWFTYPLETAQPITYPRIPVIPSSHVLIFLNHNKLMRDELLKVFSLSGLGLTVTQSKEEVIYQASLVMDKSGRDAGTVPVFIIDEAKNSQNLNWAATTLREKFPNAILIFICNIQTQAHFAKELARAHAVVTKPLCITRLFASLESVIVRPSASPVNGSSSPPSDDEQKSKSKRPRRPPRKDRRAETGKARSRSGLAARMAERDAVSESACTPEPETPALSITTHPADGESPRPSLGGSAPRANQQIVRPATMAAHPSPAGEPIDDGFPSRTTLDTASLDGTHRSMPAAASESARQPIEEAEADEQEAVDSPLSSRRQAPLRQNKVLLVEDNIVNQIMATVMIEELGYKVDAAANGLVAVSKVENSPPDEYDIILMDCQMPEMDGYAATEHIREFEARTGRPRLPIVACTAHTTPEDKAKCLKSGMDDFVTKPINDQVMADVIRRWLRVPMPSLSLTGRGAGPPTPGSASLTSLASIASLPAIYHAHGSPTGSGTASATSSGGGALLAGSLPLPSSLSLPEAAAALLSGGGSPMPHQDDAR